MKVCMVVVLQYYAQKEKSIYDKEYDENGIDMIAPKM